MPNQRAENQELLPVKVKQSFLAFMDEGMRKVGYSNRSQFVRDAIFEKLASLKIDLPASLRLPPERFSVESVLALNESASSPPVTFENPPKSVSYKARKRSKR